MVCEGKDCKATDILRFSVFTLAVVQVGTVTCCIYLFSTLGDVRSQLTLVERERSNVHIQRNTLGDPNQQSIENSLSNGKQVRCVF